MSFSLKQLRSSALLLLSKALIDLFPNTRFVQGRILDYGFQCDIVMGKKGLDKESLSYLEERMFSLIRGVEKIKYVEMLKENAVTYLRHKKQNLKASFIDENYSPGLMSFIQLGEVLEPFHGEEPLVTLEDIKNFKLLDIYPVNQIKGEQVYRIHGTAFHNKNELKIFIKQRALFNEDFHLNLASQLELCKFIRPGDHVWCSKGVKLVELLLNYWKNECAHLEIERFISNATNEVELLEDLSKFSLEKADDEFSIAFKGMFLHELENINLMGLWRSNYSSIERVFFITDPGKVKRELISSLQFISEKGIMLCLERCWIVPKYREFPAKHKKDWERAFKILIDSLEECGFSYLIQEEDFFDFNGPRAFLAYIDIFGKKWKGPFVGLDLASIKEKAIVWRSIFGSLDRYVAYLLEWFKGFLPLNIAPEQVRLIVRSEPSMIYAREMQATLAKKGFRVKIDLIKDQLNRSISKAEEEKIPYIAVIGDYEREHRTMTVKVSSSNKKDRQLAISALILELEQGIYDINSGHILSPVAFLKQINVGTDSD